MNTGRRLQIANRINLILLRELGQGIEVKRLLAEPLYTRDVLLVCDAYPGTDLAALAAHFRRESLEPGDDNGRSSGFAASLPLTADSDFAGGGSSRAAPRWLSPSRWFGRG